MHEFYEYRSNSQKLDPAKVIRKLSICEIRDAYLPCIFKTFEWRKSSFCLALWTGHSKSTYVQAWWFLTPHPLFPLVHLCTFLEDQPLISHVRILRTFFTFPHVPPPLKTHTYRAYVLFEWTRTPFLSS